MAIAAKDRNKPTKWKYDNGDTVPLWHAVQCLESHFCFGYVDNLRGKPRTFVEQRNGNPDYNRAQLAGWDAAERARHDIRGVGQAWAEAQVEELMTKEGG